MNRISIKLAGFFLSIVLVSTLVSFAAAIVFSQDIATEIVYEQSEIAQIVRKLKMQTELSVEEIVSVASTGMHPIALIEELEELRELHIDNDTRERIDAGEIVSMESGRFDTAITIIQLGDYYATIGVRPENTLLSILTSRLWHSMATYVASAGVLVVLLTHRVVHPVLRLTAATKRVARGDFTVQIESDRNDEIGQLTENFNQMVAQLRTIDHLRMDFISNVSHEIKTPLSSINGFARLLLNPSLSVEERSDYAAVICEESIRVSNLASAMLRLSKLESQASVDDKVRFRLDEQIRHTVVLLEPQWRAKSIVFDIELDPVFVTANEELLQQVWHNLLHNAIKFSRTCGSIAVTLSVREGTARVSVRDSGIGMSKSDTERVFEKFFQVERAHSGEGSGLGLSLVKRIVDLHAATIDVDSTLGEGACFTVALPGAEPESKTYESA